MVWLYPLESHMQTLCLILFTISPMNSDIKKINKVRVTTYITHPMPVDNNPLLINTLRAM